MNSFVLLYGAFVALSKLQSLNVTVDPAAWNSFKVEHGKQYQSSQEELLRQSIFQLNKYQVEMFNAEQSDKLGYKLGLNSRSDWTEQELQKLNGFKASKTLLSSGNDKYAKEFLDKILNDDSIEVPDELDWRKSPGRVSRVKDQGKCGSCWAFAATGVLEGQELSRNSSIKTLIELSEQMLLDCDTIDDGCQGGSIANALFTVGIRGGIEDESSYPYEGKKGKCSFDVQKSKMSDKGFTYVDGRSERLLKNAVAKFGPIPVAIHATSNFQQYSSGVLDDETCSSKMSQLNHAVLIVGYGSDDEQGDFWLVKNSWGESWGEKGYIRMSRNNNNQCGIANVPTLPLF